MAVETDPTYLSRELEIIDRLVHRIDTAGLHYRLTHNERDLASFTGWPATMDWLRYERQAITEELTRRQGK